MIAKYALMPNENLDCWDLMFGGDRIWNVYASNDAGDGLVRIGTIRSSVGSTTFRAEFNSTPECPQGLRGLSPEPFVPDHPNGHRMPQRIQEERGLNLAWGWVMNRLKAHGLNVRIPGYTSPF